MSPKNMQKLSLRITVNASCTVTIDFMFDIYQVLFVSKSINSHGLLNKTWFNKSFYGLFKGRFCLTWFIKKRSEYMVY